MRLFDLAGIFFVVAWVIIVGAFVFVGADDDGPLMTLTDGDIDLREETVWMTVYRAGDEAGVLREDRTLLVDGWLIEMQGIMELNLMGDAHAFRFVSRSTLNEDLTLRSATASVEAFGMELEMNGQLRSDEESTEFHVNVHLDDAVEQFIAELDEAPHLAIHAIPQMIASEDLVEGARYESEFFDPLTLSPSTIDIVYEGRDEIVNMDGQYVDAYAFRQSMGTFTSQIRTDSRGMVIQQALPLQIAIARLPEALGRNLFADFEEVFEERGDTTPPFLDAIDAEDLLALVSRFGTGEIDRLRPADGDDFLEERPPVDATREFVISPLPSFERLDLMGPNQHVAFQTSEEARIETGGDNPLWHAGLAPPNSSYEPTVTGEDSDTISELADAIAAILDDDSDDNAVDSAALRELAGEYCELDDRELDLEQSWPTDVDDFDGLDESPESALTCLALFADALSENDHPPHFVHGAHATGNDMSPRVWLAFFRDGHFLGNFDLLADSGAVGADHIQLTVNDSFQPDRLGDFVDTVGAR